MDDIRLSPYIRIAWDDREPAHWTIPRRVIFDHEIIYLESGRLEALIGEIDDRYIVEPGDILLLRPKQPHSLRSISDVPVHQPHIHFDLVEDENSPRVYISFADLPAIAPEDRMLFREDILDRLCANCPSHIRLRNHAEIEHLMKSIIYEYDNRMVHSDLLMKGLFLQLFGTLLREIKWKSGAKETAHSDIAHQARNYLVNNLAMDISLDDLADYVHASKYYLSHQFKNTFGVPPMLYFRNARINRAKQLLVRTKLSIKEIAEQTGFQSASLFTQTFQKHEQMSPSVYRKWDD